MKNKKSTHRSSTRKLGRKNRLMSGRPSSVAELLEPRVFLDGVPAAPSGLAASVISPRDVHFSWNDNSNNETSFVVQKSRFSNFMIVDHSYSALPSGSITLDVNDLLANRKAYYRVVAVNESGNSSPSNIIAVLPADFSGNGTLNAADIDAMTAQIGTSDIRYDLDGDGNVTQADKDLLIRNVFFTEYGDVNLDGIVEVADGGADGAIIIANIDPNATGRGWADGDMNGDGKVTQDDLTLAGSYDGLGGDSSLMYSFHFPTTGLVGQPYVVTLSSTNPNPNVGVRFAVQWDGYGSGGPVDSRIVYPYAGHDVVLSYTFDHAITGMHPFYELYDTRSDISAVDSGEAIAAIQIKIDDNAVSDVAKSLDENSSLSFGVVDFTDAFADADDGNLLQKVVISSLPSYGTLALNGTAVTANQEIAIADLADLTYAPNAHYVGLDSFNWNGSDVNGYATEGASVTLAVNWVNDNVVTTFERTAGLNGWLVFSADDFKAAFTDPNDGNPLKSVLIKSVPTHGTLLLNGNAITADDVPLEIAVADLDKLGYGPDADYLGSDGFRWGGADQYGWATTDASVALCVDDATVSSFGKNVDENTTLSLSQADFTAAFTDPDNHNPLQSVRIIVLPEHGTLTLGGQTVAVGQPVPVTSLGTLQYEPAAHYIGGDAFAWSGSDGSTYAVETAWVSLEIDSVADNVVMPFSKVVGENNDDNAWQSACQYFRASDFRNAFTDPDDGHELERVKIGVSPVHGVLRLHDVDVVDGQEIVVADLDALQYVPDADYVGADSFTWGGADGYTYSAAPGATVSLTVVTTPRGFVGFFSDWTGAGDVVATGTYYNADGADFTWSDGSTRQVAPRGFAATFIAQITPPQAGHYYTFHLQCGGGARVFINGSCIIDDWEVHESNAPEAVSGQAIYLGADGAEITIQYQSGEVAAPSLKLSWSSDDADPVLSKVVISNEFLTPQLSPEYSPTSAEDPTDAKFQALYVGTNGRKETPIQAIKTAAPASVGSTYYATFSGTLHVGVDGNYTFYETSNNRLRLYVDGFVLIDDWDHNDTQGTLALKAGPHTICLEYFQDGVPKTSSMAVKWSKDGGTQTKLGAADVTPADVGFVPTVSDSMAGLNADYFSHEGSHVLETNRNVYLESGQWDDGSKPFGQTQSGLLNDGVVWSGKLLAPFSGTYEFQVRGVGKGVQAWVDGVLVGNDWDGFTGPTPSRSISLVGGQTYDITVYYAVGADTSHETVNLQWQVADHICDWLTIPSLWLQAAAGSGPVIGTGTGLTGEYYSDLALDVPTLRHGGHAMITQGETASHAAGVSWAVYAWTETDPTPPYEIHLHSQILSPLPNSSATWKGEIASMYDGDYTFSLDINGGARIYIDGSLILDSWNQPGTGTDFVGSRTVSASTPVYLRAGEKHDIEIDYDTSSASAATVAKAILRWSSTSMPDQIIPTTQLYDDDGWGGEGLVGSSSTLKWVGGVDVDWGLLGPSGATQDNFTVDWRGYVVPAVSGYYKFSFLTGKNDLGVATVNSVAVVGSEYVPIGTDDREFQPADAAGVYLVAGQAYSISATFYDGTGDSKSVLEWEGPGIPKQPVPKDRLRREILANDGTAVGSGGSQTVTGNLSESETAGLSLYPIRPSYSVVNGPLHGQVVLSGAGLTYTPESGYLGNDVFTFSAGDGLSDGGSTGLERIVVHPLDTFSGSALGSSWHVASGSSPSIDTVHQQLLFSSDGLVNYTGYSGADCDVSATIVAAQQHAWSGVAARWTGSTGYLGWISVGTGGQLTAGVAKWAAGGWQPLGSSTVGETVDTSGSTCQLGNLVRLRLVGGDIFLYVDEKLVWSGHTTDAVVPGNGGIYGQALTKVDNFWVASANASESVVPDADLASAVRAALSVPANHVITRADLANLKTLTVTGNVQTLTGLSCAYNLVKLSISRSTDAAGAQIGDLTPLLGLTSLQELSLNGVLAAGCDVSVLGELTSLHVLDVRYDSLRDVTFISSLPSLNSMQLYGNVGVDEAALAGRYITLDLASGATDKATTAAELASALHHLPVRAYEWVLNNIRYEPYAGSRKSPEAVLGTLAGNDVDTSAFLKELLAACFPASAPATMRYGQGLVQCSLSELKDYFGVKSALSAGQLLVENVDAAALPLTAAGAPILASATGYSNWGSASAVSASFQYTWLELQDAAGVWHRLAPAWKFRDFQAGMADTVNFSTVPFEQDPTDGRDSDSFFSQTSQTPVELPSAWYAQKVRDYIALYSSSRTIADVSYDGPIHAQVISQLPVGLPFQSVGAVTTFAEVPTYMTHREWIGLSTKADAGSPSQDIIPRSLLSLPNSGNDPIDVGYALDTSVGDWTAALHYVDAQGQQTHAGTVHVGFGDDVTLSLQHVLPYTLASWTFGSQSNSVIATDMYDTTALVATGCTIAAGETDVAYLGTSASMSATASVSDSMAFSLKLKPDATAADMVIALGSLQVHVNSDGTLAIADASGTRFTTSAIVTLAQWSVLTICLQKDPTAGAGTNAWLLQLYANGQLVSDVGQTHTTFAITATNLGALSITGTHVSIRNASLFARTLTAQQVKQLSEGTLESTYTRKAGQRLAIGLDAGQVSQQQVTEDTDDLNKDIADAIDYRTGTLDKNEGIPADETRGLDFLSLIVDRYFQEDDQNRAMIDAIAGGVEGKGAVRSGVATQEEYLLGSYSTASSSLKLLSGFDPKGVDLANDFSMSFWVYTGTTGSVQIGGSKGVKFTISGTTATLTTNGKTDGTQKYTIGGLPSSAWVRVAFTYKHKTNSSGKDAIESYFNVLDPGLGTGQMYSPVTGPEPDSCPLKPLTSSSPGVELHNTSSAFQDIRFYPYALPQGEEIGVLYREDAGTYPGTANRVTLDVPDDPANFVSVSDSLSGDANSKRAALTAFTSSALEATVLEELTGRSAMSTTKAMQQVWRAIFAANSPASGVVEVPAYSATGWSDAGSYSSYPQVIADAIGGLSASVKADIDAKAAAGYAVYAVNQLYVPAGFGVDSLNNWAGAGYFLMKDGQFTGSVVYGGTYLSPERLAGGVATDMGQSLSGIEAAYGQTLFKDPINVATGGVTHDETDLTFPEIGVSLNFARHYDSTQATGTDTDRGMGTGWSYTYSDRIEEEHDAQDNLIGVIWFTGDGSRLEFVKDTTVSGSDVRFITPAGLVGDLTVSTGTNKLYTWTQQGGMAYTFKKDTSDTDHKYYYLSGISDRFGNRVTLNSTWASGIHEVTSVTASDKGDVVKGVMSLQWTSGHLMSVADPSLRTWKFAYTDTKANAGQLASVVPPNSSGRGSTYTYLTDEAGKYLLSCVQDADGYVTQYSYYGNRSGYKVVDAGGNASLAFYDLNPGRRGSQFVDARGVGDTFTYDASGYVTETVHSDWTNEKKGWTNLLDPRIAGQLQTSTDVFGVTETFTYDDQYRLTSHTDKSGVTTSYSYDEDAFVISAPAGCEKLGLVTTTKVGQQETHSYYSFNTDGAEVLDRSVDAAGNVTHYTYDLQGQLLTTTDAALAVTTYAYDSHGQIIAQSVSQASSSFVPVSQSFQYDEHGDLRQQTDPNGHISRAVYDALGRKLVDVNAAGKSSFYRYDGRGNMISSTDPLGRVMEYQYDGLGKLVGTVAPDGGLVTSYYDSHARPAASTDALGHVTALVYTTDGHVAATIHPDGAISRSSYSGGRLINSWDGRGNWTGYEYDKAGNLVRQRTDIGETTTAYNKQGQVSTVTDAMGHTTLHEYDQLGREIVVTDAQGVNRGLIAHLPFENVAFDEQTGTAIAYDITGNLHDAVLDGSVWATASGGGRFGGAVSSNNLLPATLLAVPGVIPSGDFSFSLWVNLTAGGGAVVRVGAHLTLTMTAATNGGSVSLATDGGTISGSTGTSWQLVTVTYNSTSDTATLYSGDVRIDSVPAGDVAGSSLTIAAVGKIDDLRVYDVPLTSSDVVKLKAGDNHSVVTAYDEVGNVQSTTDALGHTTEYEYDALRHQTAVAPPELPRSTMTYDGAGNVTSVTDALGNRTVYTYDALNRRVSATDALDAPQGLVAKVAFEGAATDIVGGLTVSSSGASLITQGEIGGGLRLNANGSVTVAAAGASQDYTISFWMNPTSLPTSGSGEMNILSWGQLTVSRNYTSGGVTAGTTARASNTSGLASGHWQLVSFTYNSASHTGVLYIDGKAGVPTVMNALAGSSNLVLSNLTGSTLDLDDVRVYGRVLAAAEVQGLAQGNHTSSTEYDDAGNVTSTKDALGRKTTYAYDPLNRMVVMTDALVGLTKTAYDVAGNVVATVDPLGNRTQYGYDAANRRASVTDALNHAATMTYDGAGNVTSVTDALGNRTVYTYDALNRRVSATDALDAPQGLVAKVAFEGAATDIVGGLTVSSSGASLITQGEIGGGLRLNANGSVTVAAAGASQDYTISFWMNPTSLPTSGSGEMNILSWGQLTVSRNYTSGGVTAGTTARASNTSGLASGHWQLVSFTYNSASHTGVLYIDGKAGVPTVMNALAGSSNLVLSNLTGSTLDLDDVRVYGRVLAAAEVQGLAQGNHTSSTEYDDAGNVTSTKDALGHTTSYGYDALNRQTSVAAPDQPAATTDYDAAGNVTSVTDALGNQTVYGYDAANRRVSVKDAMEQYTTSVYDAVGNVISVTDALGNCTVYTYDALNRQVSTTDALDVPDGLTTRIKLDGDLSDSLGGQVATASGAAWGSGRIDGGLKVASGDTLASAALAKTPNYTISFWINPSDLPAGNVNVATWGTLTMSIEAGTGRFRVTTSTTTPIAYASSGTSLQANTWQLITFAYDDQSHEGTVYINGRSGTSVMNTGRLDLNSPTGVLSFFSLHGSLDDVRVYNRALKGVEVQELAQGNHTSYTRYDAAGNVAAKVDSLENTTVYQYDALNRQLSATDPLDVPQGLITRLRLDDAMADDVGGRNATLSGQASWAAGKIKNALSLPTTGVLTIPHVPGSADYTISFWVKPVTDPSGSAVNLLTWGSQLQISSSHTSLSAGTPNGTSATAAALIGKKWQLVTLVYSQTSGAKLFVDGVSGTSVFNTAAVTGAADLLIQSVVGSLDDVRVYDRALADTEVTALAQGNHSSSAEYDAVGNVKASVDPLGNRTSYSYDQLNRRTSTVDPLVNTTTTTFDEVGNIVRVTNGLGDSTVYAYDAVGLQVSATDATDEPEQLTAHVRFDEDGSGSGRAIDDKGHTVTAVTNSAWRSDAAAGKGSLFLPAGSNGITIGSLPETSSYTISFWVKLTSAVSSGSTVLTWGSSTSTQLTITRDASRWSAGTTTGYRTTQSATGLVDGQWQLVTFTYDENAGSTLYFNGIGSSLSANTGGFTTLQAADLKIAFPVSAQLDDIRVYSRALTGGEVKGLMEGDCTSYVIYDSAGNVASSTDQVGRTTRYAYDKLGRPVSVTDPGGHTTTTKYDADGNALSVSNALGETTSYSYDALNRKVSTTDASGVALGLSLHLKMDDAVATSVKQDSSGYGRDATTTSTTAIDGKINKALWLWATDSLQVTDLPHESSDYSVSLWIKPVNLGSTTTQILQWGNLSLNIVNLENAHQVQATVGSDSVSSSVQLTQTEWFLVTFVHTTAGGKLYVHCAGTPVEDDPLSMTPTSMAGLGSGSDDLMIHVDALVDDVRVYERAVSGQEVKALAAGRNDTSFTAYDALGNVASLTDQSNNVTSYRYDADSRQIEESTVQSGAKGYEYDAAGQLTRTTDREGRVTEYDYDRAGRQVDERWIGSGAQDIHQTYDANGDVVEASDSGSTYRYYYDANGRVKTQEMVVSLQSALQGTNSVYHEATLGAGDLADSSGHLYDVYTVFLQAGDSDFSVRMTASPGTIAAPFMALHGKDAVAGDNLLHAVSGDPSGYSLDDGLPGTDDHLATTGWYDIVVKRINTQTTSAPYTLMMSGFPGMVYYYEYDAVGNRTVVIDSRSSETTTRNYDACQRPTDETDTVHTSPIRAEFYYCGDGKLSAIARYDTAGTTLKVATSTYTYDPEGRLQCMDYGTGLSKYSYEWDAADRMTQMTLGTSGDDNTNTTKTYKYDLNGQVIQDGTSDATISYDASGNPLPALGSVGSENQLTSDGQYTYGYDLDGNMTSRTGPDGTTLFGWDHRHRLVSVTLPESNGSKEVIQYGYDALNRRITESIKSIDVLDPLQQIQPSTCDWVFYYEGDNLRVRFLDADGATGDESGNAPMADDQRYFFGPDADMVLATWQPGPGGSGDPSLRDWYITDLLGSVREVVKMVVDDFGHWTVTPRAIIDYDAFGKGTVTVDDATLQPKDYPFRYTGREYDWETGEIGLYNYRARWYDPNIGRFLSTDPLGFSAGDTNLYRYAGNNPLSRKDPSGMDDFGYDGGYDPYGYDDGYGYGYDTGCGYDGYGDSGYNWDYDHGSYAFDYYPSSVSYDSSSSYDTYGNYEYTGHSGDWSDWNPYTSSADTFSDTISSWLDDASSSTSSWMDSVTSYASSAIQAAQDTWKSAQASIQNYFDQFSHAATTPVMSTGSGPSTSQQTSVVNSVTDAAWQDQTWQRTMTYMALTNHWEINVNGLGKLENMAIMIGGVYDQARSQQVAADAAISEINDSSGLYNSLRAAWHGESSSTMLNNAEGARRQACNVQANAEQLFAYLGLDAVRLQGKGWSAMEIPWARDGYGLSIAADIAGLAPQRPMGLQPTYDELMVLPGVIGWARGTVAMAEGLWATEWAPEGAATKFLDQGFTPAQAEYLTRPYEGMGHHFIGQRYGLPEIISESPLNVMKPNGISIGDFYERHFLADPYFYGAKFPNSIGGSWSGNALGLQKPGLMGRLWYGSPDALKITAGAGAAAGGASLYWWLSSDGK